MASHFSPILLLTKSDAHNLAHLEELCFSSAWTVEQYTTILPASPSAHKRFSPETENAFDHVGMLQESALVFGIYNTDSRELAAFLNIALMITAGEMEILNLAVHPAYRKQKIATRLLTGTLQLVKAVHVTQCFLEVRKSNTAAISLYSSLGFIACGERKMYYTLPDEDALIMQCSL